MAKIICKLPNAAELISGVKFVSHKLGMISEEVADEVAAEFAKIEGYVLAEAEKLSAAVTGNKGKGTGKGATPPAGATEPAGGDNGKPAETGDTGSAGSDENKSNDPPAGGSDGAN